MKIAVHLARHRRLVALGGLSLLLHLFAFVWIDGLITSPPPVAGTPIALRLVRERAPVAPAPLPAPLPVPLPEPHEAQPRQAPPAPPPAAAQAPSTAALPDAPATPPAAATPGPAPLQMPGRYRVRPPPSSTLTYAVTYSAPGGAARGGEMAQLVWDANDKGYRLRVEGVLGLLESEGADDDAGIAPNRASEALAAGGTQVTRFDREARRIEHGPLAASEPLRLGSQDRASVLMQLAGIGLAEPDQMQDAIDIVVADAGGVRIARWQVMEKEALATPAGVLATVRLVQPAPAGQARLEVWLAPQRNWLPVQLRLTQPDGSVANQVVTSIDTVVAPSGGG
jgi:hypothetical protein